MAQQTFSGVPGAFAAGAVLTAAEQELIRDFMVAQIKEGMTGDTGEILPMIMDLTNNRIVLDSGGLEFSNGSTQTVAATAVGFSGTTANGMLTYSSASTIATQSTATYASNTLTLSGAGGGLLLDGLASSNSNTLDDYEEGVATVTLAPTSSGSITIGSNDEIAYTKVGRIVHVQGVLDVGSVSSPVGAFRILGLPFTSSNTIGALSGRSWGASNMLNTAGDITGTLGAISFPNTTYLQFYTGGVSSGGDTSAAQVDGGTEILVSVSYCTDS